MTVLFLVQQEASLLVMGFVMRSAVASVAGPAALILMRSPPMQLETASAETGSASVLQPVDSPPYGGGGGEAGSRAGLQET